MEDQGKRLLLAVALALGILLLWQVIFPPEKPPEKAKTTTEETAPERSLESPVGTPLEGPAPAPSTGEVKTIERSFDNVSVAFSTKGGNLVSWQLLDKKYARDWTKGELVQAPAGAFAVNFYKSPVVIPKDAIWTELPQDTQDKVAFEYVGDGLRLTKTFTIHPEKYLLEVAVTAEMLPQPAGQPVREVTQQLAVSVVGAQDPKVPTGGGMGRVSRVRHAACHLNGDVSQISAQRLHERGGSERGGHLRWAGFNHPYLFFAVAPRADKENIACNVYPLLAVPGGMQIDLVYPPRPLRSDAPAIKKELVAYIGPKHLAQLEGADDVAGFTTAFEDSVDMGWFQIIGEPLLWLMNWFYGLTGNWGIAIILLTVLVKLATLYWTTKSMRSMRRMSALAPQMKALQAKYPDDRAKVQQEMMALYKTHGVNPLSGCLPILLQMPIWIALYRMLSSAGELYLAPFIPGWLGDLTATDPYYVLPILVTGMMFLSSRLSPTTVDNMQQKILIYGMPLIFGVMSFFFPSGLSLYILTNSTLSLLHTLYMKKFDSSAKLVPPPATKPKAEDKKAAERKQDKPVIDVEAEEAEGDEDEDEGDEDEAQAKAPARATPTGTRKTNQPRRKRKRGKH